MESSPGVVSLGVGFPMVDWAFGMWWGGVWGFGLRLREVKMVGLLVTTYGIEIMHPASQQKLATKRSRKLYLYTVYIVPYFAHIILHGILCSRISCTLIFLLHSVSLCY